MKSFSFLGIPSRLPSTELSLSVVTTTAVYTDLSVKSESSPPVSEPFSKELSIAPVSSMANLRVDCISAEEEVKPVLPIIEGGKKDDNTPLITEPNMDEEGVVKDSAVSDKQEVNIEKAVPSSCQQEDAYQKTQTIPAGNND